MKQLSRRTLLRGAGGVSLALPFLDAMRPRLARAQGNSSPRRVMFVFKPNGNEHSKRFVSKGQSDYVLGEFLEPLEPYRKQMLLLNGLNKRFPLLGTARGDNHMQGGASLAPWPAGAGNAPVGGEDRRIGYVEGPSIDVELGNRLVNEHRVAHRHLLFRVGGKNNDIWNVHAHGGPAGLQNPLSPETDPYQAYARIFSTVTFGGGMPDQTVLKRLAKQQSALDLLKNEATVLKGRLGMQDRSKLDQHLQSIRDIERTLQGATVPVGAACKAVVLDQPIDPYDSANHAIVGELFFRIGAMALACDLTRVINFAWDGNTGGRVYTNLGLSEGHHDISHVSDAAAFAKIRMINRYLWTQSVKLHEILKGIPEGDSTVWENTLIVHWNELGQGDVHSTNDDLVILTGGAQGHFNMGRLIEFAGRGMFPDLLVNIAHYMGYTDLTRFGDARLSTGEPLPNLAT